MTIHIDTWSERQFDAARVAWLAWPAEFDGKTVRANHDSVFSRNDGVAEHPWYCGNFSKNPKAFGATNYIDLPVEENIDIFAKTEWATKDRLRWHAGAGTSFVKIGMCWIGIE
jgi:hypothetical protein